VGSLLGLLPCAFIKLKTSRSLSLRSKVKGKNKLELKGAYLRNGALIFSVGKVTNKGCSVGLFKLNPYICIIVRYK